MLPAVFTLTPTPTTGFTFGDTNQDGLVDTIFGGESLSVGIQKGEGYIYEYRNENLITLASAK
jgi:hypothetical protein